MFTHLHVHTEYSLLDGACRLDELVCAAKNQGQTALAITDHGAMYGAVNFYKIAKKHGVKPIIGCEVYVAARSRFDKSESVDKEYNHLILLCKNEQGYKNLIKMVSKAFIEGFYYKPRIDRELLEEYSDGLICLSACIAGSVPRAILRGENEKALAQVKWFKNVFGDGNYYLELQDHGMSEQKIVNNALRTLSQKTGVPLVATNDVHYITKSDSAVQELLLCIQTNHRIGEDTGLSFSSEEFYLKSEEEMCAAFPSDSEAIANTAKIADECNLDFEFGNINLPYFDVPNNENHFDYFKKKCVDGLKRRYGNDVPDEYKKRLAYEMQTVNKMGYVDYYLIVADFIEYAKSQSIPVGPGRGSGAGSLAAYCMGITNIDPMKYQLLFERFLNPERISMPDFDIDFCYERRGEVIDYVINKYGSDHVAQIITFGTLAAKAAIQDCGRAMGMPFATVNAVSKLVPFMPGITIDKALEQSQQLRQLCQEDEKIAELIQMARKIEGMPRNSSTHAAGVVITQKPVNEYVPLASNDGVAVTQYDMTTLEELGLLKMDFLGLRTLTVIDQSEKMVRQFDENFRIENISITDEKVFDLFAKGETEGIFQFESEGMKRMLIDLKPRSLEDLIAATSLYRPGPASQIDTFIANRHKAGKITYKTPLLEGILGNTYGCMVYQEQVMQIFRTLAGYSYGRADIVRRAMSKKKLDVMQKERENFIHGLKNPDGTVECVGALANGVSLKAANEIFDDMAEFAKYAFNKSHAAAYALIAYQTAYIKTYYPCQFMAALLTSVLDRPSKVARYIAQSKRLGLELVKPDINLSSAVFSASGNKISYGLLGIKNLGDEFIKRIVNERQNGKYKSILDFCTRLQGRELNRRAVESLVRAGCFDSFGYNRRQLLQVIPTVISSLDTIRRNNVEGQIGFFNIAADEEMIQIEYPNVPDFSKTELLQMEKELTGLYLSGHPLEEFESVIASTKSVQIKELLEVKNDINTRLKDGTRIQLFAVVEKITKKTVRNSNVMAFMNVEDTAAAIEAIVFPKTLLLYEKLLHEGAVLQLQGKLSIEDEKDPKIIVEKVLLPQKTAVQKKRIYCRFNSREDDRIATVSEFIARQSGADEVYFYYKNENEYEQLSGASINVNNQLLIELEKILGKQNMAIKII